MRALAIVALLASPVAASSHASLPCTDSEVVGHDACGLYFGTRWSTSMLIRLWTEVGVVASRFDGAVSTGGSGPRGDRYRVTSPGGTMTALAYRMRIGFGFGHRFYFPTDLDFGGVTRGPDLALAPDGPGTAGTATAGGYRGFTSGIGVGGRLGPVALSVELAAGERGISLNAASVPGLLAERIDFVLDSRVRVDYWIAPHFTLSATGGTSLVDAHARELGLAFGWHMAAFR